MTPAAKTYDAVIAGAGPAGCAAAITLHRAGLRICLVDDAPDARPKVGEALPGAARRLLHQLGIAGIESLLAPHEYTTCQANASAWGSDRWTYQDALLNPEGGGWHLDRTAFDAALRRRVLATGIPLYQARISQITNLPGVGIGPADHQLQLRAADGQPTPTLRSPWLIDATGRAAFVSRRLQGGRHKLDNQMAAVAWVAATPHDPDQATRIKSGPAGWWYTARLPTGQRVISFHGLPASVAEFVRCPAEFLAQFNAAGLLPHAIAVTPSLQVKALDASVGHARQAAMAGLVCVGDAALAFDPLSSQGMFFALYSGIMAGETLARCVASPTLQPTYLGDYRAQVNRVLAANQQTRRYFYLSECRYRHEPYWLAQITSFR